MTISLYDASAALFIQTLGAMDGFLSHSLKHFRETSVDPEEIVETRLFADMLPFRYQVQAAIGHSVGAIEGVRSGVFNPPHGNPKANYAGLQKEVADALAALKALTPAEVNALEGKDMIFKLGERAMPFVGEHFLMTFSLPNVHFHATTAYDILRQKGVPLGKRNYLGAIKMKV